MTLTGISGSSNVVASGYKDGLLRIVFSDGAVYDATDVPAEINAAFLASPSKGQFVHLWLKDKLTPVGSTKNQNLKFLKLREPEPSTLTVSDLVGAFEPLDRTEPLNSHDPDPCCGRLLGEALRTGKLHGAIHWECPKCGMQWRPREGATLRNWSPHPYTTVVPVRG